MRHFPEAPSAVSSASTARATRAGWAVRALVALGFLAQAPAQDVEAPFADLRVGLARSADARTLFARPDADQLRASTDPFRRGTRQALGPAAVRGTDLTLAPADASTDRDVAPAILAVRVAQGVTVSLAGSREPRPEGDVHTFSAAVTVAGF